MKYTILFNPIVMMESRGIPPLSSPTPKGGDHSSPPPRRKVNWKPWLQSYFKIKIYNGLPPPPDECMHRSIITKGTK